jgi:DMSO/TMAO reductase YedYZ molybdopterin-dependent catalytic subunit
MASDRKQHDPLIPAPHLAREDLAEYLDSRRARRPHSQRVLPDAGPSAVEPDVPTPSRFAETPPPKSILPSGKLKAQTRRDFLIYGVGVAAAVATFLWVLPDETRTRVGFKPAVAPDPRKVSLLNRALTFDDDVAEALFSPNRLVPTYDLSQAARELRNNYDGQTPDPADYLADWTLTVKGLASGQTEHLTAKAFHRLVDQYGRNDQVTRLCCVEGWSMIAGWGGLRFADFLEAYPPMAGAKWASLESSVNLDSDGNSDPYYVSLDLPTAMHPQTLLATHQNDPHLTMVPLTAEHGAPLRLLVPMKLGLKNIKAITGITYSESEPPDYWAERGYSKYDGL